MVLQFDKADIDELAASDLSHRHLWAPAVDQLLADENVVDDETLWAMTDRQGSVTDMVDNNGTDRLHRVFDSFGNTLTEDHYDTNEIPVTNPADTRYVDEAFAYTGRFFDKDTGKQYNTHRWYDPKLGRWMSEDPIKADVNSSRYVGNSPVNGVDPSGLCTCKPDQSEIDSGEARSLGDIDHDGKPDYEFPRELPGTGFKVYCLSGQGPGFIIKGPNGGVVHRCPFPDGTRGSQAGVNEWSYDKKAGIYRGIVADPGTNRMVDYTCWATTNRTAIKDKVRIRVWRDGKVVGQKIIKAPKNPNDFPFPNDLVR